MKYLGIDFGLKRVGLAVSEGELVSPWQIIKVKNFTDAVEKISKIINDGDYKKIVVGLPEGKMGKNVVGFVNALGKRGFRADIADETLSSQKALETMIEKGIRREKRRYQDAYSAAEILQNYLDSL